MAAVEALPHTTPSGSAAQHPAVLYSVQLQSLWLVLPVKGE